MLFEDYEKILTKGKRVEWHGISVPKDLLTPTVQAVAQNIIETINKFESIAVDKDNKKQYICTLWDNLKNLPYKLNNDFFLIKKNKIEENLKQKPLKESKKEETTNSKKVTKNSSLIFGNKK